MKRLVPLFLITLLMLNGCAYFHPSDVGALSGTNIGDLERARSNGKTATFPLSYDAAFDRVVKTLESKEEMEIFKANKRKKHIVVMGFVGQVDTTRAGIFFEVLGDNKTKVTLSSLSKTVLAKAEKLVFEGLEK